MISRMEKYYKNNIETKQRSQKNKDLYRNIYHNGQYSNIEGIATMDNSNEVDITKVQKMLKNREDYKKQRQYIKLTHNDEEEKEISNEFVYEEQKNYDIRDILNKAKDKKPNEDTPRSLDNTNYNILKNLKLNKNDYNINKDFKDDDLKELIDTITNTSILNQMNDKELGLNMLDLDNTDEKLDDNNSIKQLLEQAKKYEENKNSINQNIDNSFFTSSLNFNKDDFEEVNEYFSKNEKTKLIFKILLFVLLIIITCFIIFGIYYLIK